MSSKVLEVAVDEGFVDVKPHSNDVLCIIPGILHDFFEGELLPEERLLVIGQHDNEWHVEDILQPACELKRDRVSDVYAAAAWTASSVEKKSVATLVAVEYPVEITVAKEEAPP